MPPKSARTATSTANNTQTPTKKTSSIAGSNKPAPKKTYKKPAPKPTSPSAANPGKKLVRDEYRSDVIPGKRPKDPQANSTASIDSSHESTGQTEQPVQADVDMGPARQGIESQEEASDNSATYSTYGDEGAYEEDGENTEDSTNENESESIEDDSEGIEDKEQGTEDDDEGDTDGDQDTEDDDDGNDEEGNDEEGGGAQSLNRGSGSEESNDDPKARAAGKHDQDDNTSTDGAAAFSKFMPKGNTEQKMKANSKPKGGPKPSGKKPLWN
ncbi:MAG: hypothetical protein EOO05_03045 [Chitinophagaceae bacterium]|nr:MAG: hypothetical protein EOO05_03045 [Chitinophagaceae bacterium]